MTTRPERAGEWERKRERTREKERERKRMRKNERERERERKQKREKERKNEKGQKRGSGCVLIRCKRKTECAVRNLILKLRPAEKLTVMPN